MRTLGMVKVALVAVLLVAGAACGDDDDGLSKAEFIAQANTVCEESNDKFDALFETDFPAVRGQITAFFEKATPILSEEVDRLRDLEPPSDDVDRIEELLDAGDAAVEDFERAETDAAFAAELFNEEGGEDLNKLEDGLTEYGANCDPDEGDEDDGPPERKDISAFPADKRAYIERADAVCKTGQDKLSSIDEEVFGEGFPPTIEKWAEGAPKLAAAGKAMIAELRKLNPPAADRATVTALLDRSDALFDRLDDGAKLAQEGKEAEFSTLVAPVFNDFEELDADLVEYGFQVCGPEDEDGEGEGEEGEE